MGFMSDTTGIRRRIYGPLYWVPVPAGLLTTFYAGTCLQGYCDTGRAALLALAIFASSLGATLVTAGVRSYAVAAVNGLFTVSDVIVVARSGQWPLMSSATTCQFTDRAPTTTPTGAPA